MSDSKSHCCVTNSSCFLQVLNMFVKVSMLQKISCINKCLNATNYLDGQGSCKNLLRFPKNERTQHSVYKPNECLQKTK